MTALRAVVFDLDDTLYPERAYIRSGFLAVARWCGQQLALPEADVQSELQALFDGGYRGDTFNRWLAGRSLPSSFLPELLQVYRNHAPEITLEPETSSILDLLYDRYLLGLITEGRRHAQEAKIAALGVERWMRAVVICGEEERAEWKPSRRPFERGLGLLRIAGEEAVYVGDNPGKDFRGAREAGLRTIRLRRKDGLHSAEEPATPADAPVEEITSLTDLPATLA
jgi:putative hydrolase of the HAD superfamily